MFDHLQSVAYKCVIPAEQETTVPTPVYHSPADQSGEVVQEEASRLKQAPFPELMMHANHMKRDKFPLPCVSFFKHCSPVLRDIDTSISAFR
jgi:hypothetical protein